MHILPYALQVVFTYAHIWLALWMMFYPIDYLGKWRLPPVNFGLGWQASSE